MSRITNFDSLPAFGAAAGQGPAIAATFPFARPSLSQSGIARFLERMIARWRAARKVRRTVHALAALDDKQLRDIGLNRANIVSAAHEAGVQAHRADLI